MQTLIISLLSTVLFMTAQFAGNSLNAQSQVQFGIKGGVNASKVYGGNQPAWFGYQGGFSGLIPIRRNLAIQPELLFSAKGIVFSPLPDQKSTYQLNYLDLPVLLAFKLAAEVEVHVGGYASYLLHTSPKYDDNTTLPLSILRKDDFHKMDFGLISGLGFRVGKIQLGVRYNFGLQKLARSTFAAEQLHNSKLTNAQLFLALNL